MNAAVCGFPVRIHIDFSVDEEKVVNDFCTVRDDLHLSRIGVQGAHRR